MQNIKQHIDSINN